MPIVVCNVAALMVAGLFYCWRAYQITRLQRAQLLRERVAYMLWVMAHNLDERTYFRLTASSA
jgi:hypothetical protein